MQKDQSTELIQMLIDRGADVNRVDLEGATPLYTAMQVEVKPSFLQVLLRAGGWMDRRRFLVASFHGHPVLCRQILKARVLITICSARTVRRIGKNSSIKVLNSELVRLVGEMLFEPIGDDNMLSTDGEGGGHAQ